MLIRRISFALVMVLIASSAFALDVQNLLSLVAMPLAVAAASDLNGVQQNDLIDLVTQLNQANVPPTEFVQIVRYVPVALIDQNGQPQIVQYVTTETSRGVTGSQLATNIADELRMRYDVPRFELTPQQPVVVETTEIIPQVVTTRVNNDLFSLIGMPLAVAAAADIAGVPQQELMNVVAQLNQANVPPAQFVEVVHYVPVALVNTNTAPQFVDYVTTQVNNGVTGPALATVVADRLRTTYGAREINVVAPQPQRVIVTEQEPVQVVHVHPHGGPPGQLKKIYGLQTGAQVVHGTMPPGQAKHLEVAHEHGHGHGRGHERAIAPQPVFVPQPMISSAPQPIPGPPAGKPGKGHGGNPHGGPPGNPGHGNGNDNGNGHGHGKGKG